MTTGEADGTVQRGARTPNSVLRGIRENERRESRGEFADAMARLGWETGAEVYPDANYVMRLESGHITWPHRTYRNILEQLCGRPAHELGFAPSARSGDNSTRVNTVLRESIWGSGYDLTEFARKVEINPKTAERWITRGVTPQPFRRWKVSLMLGIDEHELWPDAVPCDDIPESKKKAAAVAPSGNSSVIIRRPEQTSSRSEPPIIPDPLYPSLTSDTLEPMKRREFLSNMAAVVGFSATTGMIPSFKHVDPELIPYFQRQLEGHYQADMLLGPRALISTVVAQCNLIGQLVDSADEPTRQRMSVVGTSYAAFAAWLYLDAGDIAAALNWHNVAQEMAHRSRDREAISCALVDRAMARTDQGIGTAVVDLCNSALMDAGHLSPELRVFALQQQAHGASLIGDRRQVDALLDAAGQLIDQVDVEFWGTACLRTPHYVEVQRATCYGRLGLAKEALGVWQQIIPSAPSGARRDVGVWVARQATLSASLREPEWTVELARHAVKVALETGSARVRRELAATKATMTPWQSELVGQDFAEVMAPISEGI